MTETFAFAGERAIEEALRNLGSPTSTKRAGRAALREAGEPLRALIEQMAPEDAGDLKRSIKMAPGKRDRSEDGDQAIVVIGIDKSVQPARYLPRKRGKGAYRDPGVAGVGPIKEFGDADEGAQPFFRPAWEAMKGGLPARIGRSLGPAIETEARRLAQRKGGV